MGGSVIRWFDIAEKRRKLKPVSIFIGARGVGKTYSAISYVLEFDRPFIYLRNTDVQIQECCTVFGNPFKRWALDHNRDIFIKKEGKHANIYERSGEDVRILGYACALSTFENLRGIDLSDVGYVLYDEFIEQNPLRFKQFDTFSNFYETVNRNRELTGEAPLQVIMLSNAQKLDNDILRGYGLVSEIENMIRNGRKEYSRKFLYFCMAESEVSKLKEETALYQNSKGSAFYDQAIKNEFSNENFTGIKKQPLSEYKGIAKFDDLYIYEHKSLQKIYICTSRCVNVPEYSSANPYIFMRYFSPKLAGAYAGGCLFFESFTVKSQIIDFII